MREEQVAAYIAGCDAAVEEARLAMIPVLHNKAAYAQALAEWRRLRVIARYARLDAYGIECDHCEGTGEMVRFGGYDGPDRGTCPCCHGDGRVLPAEAMAWTNRQTERDPDEAYDARFDVE
jgi:hypothetical protein